MLDFLLSKNRLLAHKIKEVPIQNFELLGIGSINPYYTKQTRDGIFVSLVNIANESKQYDEKEGLILTRYFTIRKCPKCRRIKLIPTKIKVNMDSTYLKYEEEIAYDAFEEHPSRRHLPSIVEAYCGHCFSCFEIRIKNCDTWVKEAKKIKSKDLIFGSWDEYCIE